MSFVRAKSMSTLGVKAPDKGKGMASLGVILGIIPPTPIPTHRTRSRGMLVGLGTFMS